MPIQVYKTNTPYSKVLVSLCVATGYFILASLGLELATLNDNASPIWPASGLALGSLLLFGNWTILAIYPAAFLANYLVGTSPGGLLLIPLGNTLEAIIAAGIIRWILKKDTFKSYSELFSLLIGSAIGCTVAASFGTTSLRIFGNIPAESVATAWYTWWSGDMVGIMIMMPLFLAVFRDRKAEDQFNWQKLGIGLCLSSLIVMNIYGVFVREWNEALAWSMGPLFIIIGILSGRIFANILLIAISAFIIYLTSLGYGPFEQGNLNRNLLYVQTLILNFSFAMLFVKPLSQQLMLSKNYLLGLCLGWFCLFAATYTSSYYQRAHTRDDFLKSVDSAMKTLDESIKSYDLLLQSSASFFSIRDIPNTNEWDLFVSTSKLARLSDVVTNIGFIEIVKDNELSKYSKKQHFKIRNFTEPNPYIGQDHYIVALNAQFIGQFDALGLDFGSEKIRREGIERSIKLKDTGSSEPYGLLYPAGAQGIAVYHPVERNGSIMGFTYFTAQTSLFYKNVFSRFSHALRIRINANKRKVYAIDKYPDDSYKNGPFLTTRNRKIYGVDYSYEFYPTEMFFQRHTGYTAPLALILNTFILFIAGFILDQLTLTEKTRQIIDEKTRELEQSKFQLIQSSKMASLGEMASGMAHEINNPLTIIKGKVEVLSFMLEDSKLKEPQIFLELYKIKQTADRIDKIIKGLSNFSRASSNDPFEFVLMDKIIQETLEICSEKFKSHGISLRLQEFPKGYLRCRPSEVAQVLINLLNNSADAISEDPERWIEINFKVARKGRLWIMVTDSGAGIPVEIAEKIMEPFFTTKDPGRGTGLGLSIARNIMEAHKGKMWLDRGHPHTRFVLEFEYVEHQNT